MLYHLRGKVIHGDGWGRKMGYPTANLDRRYFVHHPVPKGVWACRVRLYKKVGTGRDLSVQKVRRFNNWLKGIAVIGETGEAMSRRDRRAQGKVEVYIIDFNNNIYGWHCEAEIVQKIRSLRKYGSPRALAVQIGRDIETARRVLGKPS